MNPISELLLFDTQAQEQEAKSKPATNPYAAGILRASVEGRCCQSCTSYRKTQERDIVTSRCEKWNRTLAIGTADVFPTIDGERDCEAWEKTEVVG